MITFNLKDGGLLTLSADDIISYTQTFKGSMIVYLDNGEEKSVEVYEAPSRIKNVIECHRRKNHE